MRERTALDTLLAPGGVTPYYQPIYALTSNGPRLFGFECLARGPRGTNFESAKVLFDYVRLKRQEALFDRICISTALRALPPAAGGAQLSVNVHASTLARDAGFTDFFVSVTETCRLQPSQLTVEIVEHAPPYDSQAFLRAVERLRGLGVSIALDDIGLGQSNFKMLLDVSPEMIKLDRYFVDGCHADPKRCAVIDSIVSLARNFRARVVAEGVETVDDLETVQTLGITLVQGFLLSHPLSVGDLTARTQPPAFAAAV
jgi:EAL domain-containing protein (putative c-di-GMP-specific phosphodiesterase class I)